MIGCDFGSSGLARYGAPAGNRVSVSTVPGMKWKKRERVADGRDVARERAEYRAVFGRKRQGENHQRDDGENVRIAETSVLEDAQASQAREHRAAGKNDAATRSRRDLLVARECSEPGSECDQADRGMRSPQRRRPACGLLG